MTALPAFTPSCRAWFEHTFDAATPVQLEGWGRIAAGEHALLLAPTGSGKTLAAFFFAIDQLMRLPVNAPPGVRVLYISPLKALVTDIERNLRAPLVGCLRQAERLGQPCRHIRVDIRTGDTPSAERRRQLQQPADILVTTPESLFLLLGSKAAETLRDVHTVIIDEIHALAPSKRGVHLALSLERLTTLCAHDPQRIGLSATVHPHQEAAQFLGGDRPVAIVDKSGRAHIDMRIVVPVPDMDKPPEPAPEAPKGGAILGQLAKADMPKPKTREMGGMWAAIYPAILEHIMQGQATIVFVNSRSLCERMAQRLNELAQSELVRAHHGSLSHAKRKDIEEALKSGQLKGIVATSSLELGIDMGALDLVILVESPGSVSRGLQRVGRAGHAVGEKSRGIIFPKFRGDLLECTVVTKRMREGLLEPIAVPHNALDVLSQHIVAMCVHESLHADVILTRVRRAYPYKNISHDMFVAVLEMLSGTYPSDEFADLRPHLAWDRTTDVLSARRGAKLVSVLNAGTIADRGMFGVFLGAEGPRVGELDEEMVHESRRGDCFLLGASTWRIEDITRDRVVVSPAPGEPGKMPFWRGDGPGRPIELGRAVGAFIRQLGAMSAKAAHKTLTQDMGLDAYAAQNVLGYITDQRQATGTLPTDRSITIERFRDELGDWRICILSPFGARVHAPWALALEHQLTEAAGYAVQTLHSDDGIVLRIADGDNLPDLDALVPDVALVDERVMGQLAHSAMFATHFRENAARALLLPRRRAQLRTPLWQQRLRSKALLAAAQRYAQFPIILETYRHCLKDIFDVPALKQLLHGIARREVHVVEVETQQPSPFARSLAFAYVAAYLYEQDAPLAERRAQALTLDRDLLRELLGEVELRDLLDAAVVDDVEAQLQHTAESRQARDADEVHDLLRKLGDLNLQELAARTTESPAAWLDTLVRQRRALVGRIAGETRYIAAEEAGLYRDAFGYMPPGGLPDTFVASHASPLVTLCRRYARTHGPFITQSLAARYALRSAQIAPVLDLLEAQGVIMQGELRPGGHSTEWCDVDVMRRLKRGTLARLREATAAVDSRALVRFLPLWHGLDAPKQGMHNLEGVIAQLEGIALPFSTWCRVVLPARLTDFVPDMLDMLCATGVIVWVGHGALGQSDGRVKLLRRTQAAKALVAAEPYAQGGPLHQALLAHFAARGACFMVELSQVVKGAPMAEVEQALWDLVWGGYVTNDTVQPLRALQRRRAKAPRHHRGRSAAGAQGFGGRWSLVANLIDPSVTPTERAHVWAHQLLERYGIVSREAVAAEDLLGGFAAVYPIYKAMEEAGRARRGYFVEGLSGLQFAFGSAVERLRVSDQQTDQLGRVATVGPTYMLAAVDPANPFGTLLPWPQTLHAGTDAASPPKQASTAADEHKPAQAKRLRRTAGAWVVIQDGALLLYVEANGQHITTFDAMWQAPEQTQQAVLALMHIAHRRNGRSMRLVQMDQVPILRHPRVGALIDAGGQSTFDGVTIAPKPWARADA